MTRETAKRWATRLLLAFVLVSLGYAAGRERARRANRNKPAQPAVTPVPAGQTRVTAYYFHGTIRCVTCNQIERTAKLLLDTEFAKDQAAGRLLWREVNFEQEPELARRYDVAASTLVLAREVNGKETSFRRLDEVWPLADTPEELRVYVRKNLQELLP